ncbi:MAG: aspartate aminotransferase family protein, partial [Planctomycetota bacterium]
LGAGIAVNALGHAHPALVNALTEQAHALWHVSNLYNIPQQQALADKLVEHTFADTVFFTNSGTEGIEVALKYARAATAKSRFIHCERAYHGLTMGALSLNGNEEFRDGFGSLIGPSTQIPFNDIDALRHELEQGDVCAFVVEPIQGKGVNIPSSDYLRRARELCTAHGALFVLDEIQTGFGRTGTMWACEQFDVSPDIMVVAKALSGGYIPVGAVLSRRWIHDRVFSSMERCCVQQTTFSQNDLAMVAGLATLDVIEQEGLIEHTRRIGTLLKDRLRGLAAKHDILHDVRGMGLMLALEFRRPRAFGPRTAWDAVHAMSDNLFCQAILMPLLAEHGVLAQVAGHRLDVIKLIPPLVLQERDVDRIVDALDTTIGACEGFPGPAWSSLSRIAKNVVVKPRRRQRTVTPSQR